MSFQRRNIQKMTGYTSGEQPDDPNTLKLNTNENPYPPSDRVAEVIQHFEPSELRRYPPPTAAKFCQAAAELHDLEVSNIIATRGGDELLRLVITTFVDPGELIGVTNPTYSLYPVLAEIQDCPLIEIDHTENWELPLNFADEMNGAGVKLTMLTNPHAPSGSLIPLKVVSNLASQLDSLLLLDEAYIDFVEGGFDSPRLISEHGNLIILRTLSKGYSLAGLRFGYGIAAPELINPMLTKTKDSYNLDRLSQHIAEVAITDQASAQRSWGLVIKERNRLQQELTKLGFICATSHSNFLLVSPPVDAEQLYLRLKDRHILVRHFALPRLRDKLRITVGNQLENDRLISTVLEILGFLQNGSDRD